MRQRSGRSRETCGPGSYQVPRDREVVAPRIPDTFNYSTEDNPYYPFGTIG